MTEPTTVPEPGCGLCAGISVVTYSYSADNRPSPSCGRCGREIPLRLVHEGPQESTFENRARRAAP